MKRPHEIRAGELTGRELGEWITLQQRVGNDLLVTVGGQLTSFTVQAQETWRGTVIIILGDTRRTMLPAEHVITVWTE